ncbi:MAG: S8 family serine peptidase [Flavobacteriales bacterium]
MMRTLLALLALVLPIEAAAQTAPHAYWVRFVDKTGTPFSLNRPEEFLSERSISRRLNEGIGFDERDLPVNPAYISQVMGVGNLTLHNRSKWFNACTIRIQDTLLEAATLEALAALPCVAELRRVNASRRPVDKLTDPCPASRSENSGPVSEPDYGPSFRQISMLNGHLLHQMNYTGKGVRIAVFDGGWSQTDVLPAFKHLYESGRIAGTRDFVTPEADSVYFKSAHGTYVLSHMAGIIPDSLMGTAPDAIYYLFRTEDVNDEFLIEEDNWVAAAEYADSIGVDLINSSLGYSLFDDPAMDHSYGDMDGETARSSIAADIASEKGILVVNSAGNSGASAWRYITAPGDGDFVLCVGAVDADSLRAFFSSYGPSSDGDVKPNVMAMGRQTVFADLDSTIRRGNGTSFSAPIITGLAACLMEAFPLASARDVFLAIQESAHLYSTPNDSLGHGLPDFHKAYELLRKGQEVFSNDVFDARLFPNPAPGVFTLVLEVMQGDAPSVRILDASGREVRSPAAPAGPFLNSQFQGRFDIRDLADGIYFVEITNSSGRMALRLSSQSNE